MAHFQDRIDAGRQLGKLLAPRIDGPAVVLGVPRAGVQVGAQVAEALHAPLLPLLVRKVGLPEQPDVVVGAIDADGAMTIARENRDAGLLPGEIESMGEDVAIRLARWRIAFGAPEPAAMLQGHVAVVVDDAVLSGLTLEAGIGFLRRRGAERVIVAVPTGVGASLDRLASLGAEIVCPVRIDDPSEISGVYKNLPEVNAEEVSHLLAHVGPSQPKGLSSQPLGERSVRLVDGKAVPHKAILRLPTGAGPYPAMVMAGPGVAPLTSSGDAIAVRLSEAGIASLRIAVEGGDSPHGVLELALDVLAARPEIDAYRLGIVSAGELGAAASEVGFEDRRVVTLVLLEPPEDVEPPDRSMVVQADAFDPRTIDRVARWLADRLRPV